jgi:hypothetical protein
VEALQTHTAKARLSSTKETDMKRNTSSTLVLASAICAAILTSSYAIAQTAVKDPTATPRIDQRQVKQQARIDKGVASGKIAPAEQATLQAQQNQIVANKAAAKADGVVTRQERKALRKQQNQASRAIAHKKHNLHSR